MSKKEKLTKLLFKVRKFCQERNGKCLDGLGVIEAFRDYETTPDDPPQPPEMPECVRRFLDATNQALADVPVQASIAKEMLSAEKAIDDHYRQPLKLEVGKVYADEKTFLVDIVWHNPMFEEHFVGVRREGGLPRIYSSCGVCMTEGGNKIIQEVKHQ